MLEYLSCMIEIIQDKRRISVVSWDFNPAKISHQLFKRNALYGKTLSFVTNTCSSEKYIAAQA